MGAKAVGVSRALAGTWWCCCCVVAMLSSRYADVYACVVVCICMGVAWVCWCGVPRWFSHSHEEGSVVALSGIDKVLQRTGTVVSDPSSAPLKALRYVYVCVCVCVVLCCVL